MTNEMDQEFLSGDGHCVQKQSGSKSLAVMRQAGGQVSGGKKKKEKKVSFIPTSASPGSHFEMASSRHLQQILLLNSLEVLTPVGRESGFSAGFWRLCPYF